MDTEKGKLRARELVLQGIILLLLLAAFFPRTFFLGELTLPGAVVFDADPWKQHAPADLRPARNWLTQENLLFFAGWYAIAADSVRNGEWPLWNPYQFTGMPLLANYQSAALYPLRFWHLFLDPDVASTLHMLVRLWICGMTAYVFGRKLELGKPAACFLSIAFAYGGYNITWFYWPDGDVIAWLPVMLLGLEYILRDRLGKGFCGVVCSAVLMLLAGHPESAFTIGLSCGIYFLIRLAMDRRWGARLWRPLAVAGFAWVAAVLIAAPQILPFVEYLRNSHTFVERTAGHGQIQDFPLDSLVVLWAPRFFGTVADGNYWGDASTTSVTILAYASMLYVGMPVWMGLAVLPTAREWNRRTRHMVFSLVVVCALNLLLTFRLGFLEPIHQLPVFNSMWRCWHIAFSILALPYLGALGLQTWFSQRRKMRQLLWPIGAALLMLAALWGLFAFNERVLEMKGLDASVRGQIALAAVLMVASLMVLATDFVMRKPAVLMTALAVLLAADLLVASRNQLPTCPREWMRPRTELTSYLKGLPVGTRVHALSLRIRTGLLQLYGVEQWWGYDAMFPARIRTFCERTDKTFWDIMEPACGISHVLHNPEFTPLFPLDEPDRFDLVAQMDGVDVYKDNRAMPRAFLVGSADVVEDKDALFERMSTPGFDPAQIVLLEKTPEGGLPDPATAPLGTAELLTHSPTRAEVAVHADKECLLVLSDAFYPGWRAYVDDEPAEILPAYHAFRAVKVPAGEHTVRFRYQPRSLQMGLGVSVATLVACLGIACCVALRTFKPQC